MNSSFALVLLCGVLLAGCVSYAQRPAPPAGAAAKLEFTVKRNVVYTPANWPAALGADLYQPASPGLHPAVIVVHGGGWDSRDRSDMDSISKKFARRGYVVANLDYRLAPAFLYPAQLDDVRAGLKYLRANAAALRIDPARIGAWGYSAGAHLVALAATRDGPLEARIQAVVAGGTPADLTRYPKSPIITKFIGASFADAQKTWIEASPITHVSPGDPPMFLYHGKWDRLVYVEDSIAMSQALERAQVPVELYLIRGSGHISTFLLGFGAEAAGMDFLDRYLRAPPPARRSR